MSRLPKSTSTQTHPKSLVPRSKPETANSAFNARIKSTKSNRCLLPKPATIALIILILASSAGVAFSIITSIVLQLHTEGDIPSRILVFVASILSIVEGCLYLLVLVRRKRRSAIKRTKPTSIRASLLIVSRLILVAWIASSVLISLLIAQLAGDGIAVFSLSAPLVDQAIYLDLIISSIALISSGVLSYYSERSRSPFKGALSTQRSVIDARQPDTESLESGDIRDTIFDGEPVISEMETVSDFGGQPHLSDKSAFFEDDFAAEPRPKKLLFSYKSSTQLVDENRMSMDTRKELTGTANINGTANSATEIGTADIKRKPVPIKDQVEANSSNSEPLVLSTFFLSPRIDGGDDRKLRLTPHSPAVNRPISLVPPVPVVPVIPSTKVHPIPAPKTDGVKRKPVGAPVPEVGPIKRKPVARVYPKTTLLPTIVEPSIDASPQLESVPGTLPTARSTMLNSKSARTLSTTSVTSTYSIASPTSPQQSLADMIVSSLRRDSAVSYSVPPPPTSSVAYAQPKVFDQPIIRKSFIATSGGFGLPAGISSGGSTGNSRRPSAVSIMETIYSPAEEEQCEEQTVAADEQDSVLAAMLSEEAAAAAIFANAGRFSVAASPSPKSKKTEYSGPGPAVASSLPAMSRTSRRARKEAAREVIFPRSPPHHSRRSPSRAGYNFSRPMRGTSRISASSLRISVHFNKTTHAKSSPRSSAILSPRSRVRRQLLQMLPVQYRPKPTAVSTQSQARVSLSGRRHRQSLSIDLVSDSEQGYRSDSEPDSRRSSRTSSRISRSSKGRDTRAQRILPLAAKAQQFHRQHRSGRIAGLRNSTLQTASHKHHTHNLDDCRLSHSSPHTPQNRPISPMTLLMKRSLM